MEEEYFISGYCRAVDGSRTVTVETDGTRFIEADCNYGTCPHEPNCQIAQRIRALENRDSR